MKRILNHHGIGFPTVLGIVVFLLAGSVTAFTLSYRNSTAIHQSLEHQEAYDVAEANVRAALHIIAREENLDPLFLQDLALYLGITITPYADQIWLVSDGVDASTSVNSYITGAAVIQSTYDLFLSQTGKEPGFVLDPFITPTSMTIAYTETFLTNDLGITTLPALTDFSSVITYFSTLPGTGGDKFVSRVPTAITNQTNPTVTGNWYVTNTVTLANNKNLTVQPGFVLVINGDLNLGNNCTFSGVAIVKGNVKITGKTSTTERLRGTIYAGGTFSDTGRNLVLGTSTRPSFLVTVGRTTLPRNVSGYGYFLCNEFVGSNAGTVFTGGAYGVTSTSFAQSTILPNTNLNPDLLYSYGVAPEITVADSIGGFVNIRFTFPSPSS